MKKKNLHGKTNRKNLPCEDIQLYTSNDFVK